jgi:crotonobetainyl-CoA:carnitine CoA-transferase CaiB-like acyl-CoA transferase
LWWRSLARNKRCIVVDLRKEEGRDLVRTLARSCDAIVENFRPGTMEAWGLGPEDLRADHPELVYVRVSGFGQTGPYRKRAGFASVCEAMAGLRHITGVPGGPSVRSNLSLGDTLGGLHATIGLLLALIHRGRTGEGQVVDVALTESVLNVLESVLPEFEHLGLVRGPSGATITGVVPSNVYPCKDGRSVVLGANTDRLFVTLMRVIGRADLASAPDLQSNPGRVARAADIDAAVTAWTLLRPLDDAVQALTAEGIPAGPINDARDIARDPHFIARGLWERVDHDGRSMALPAIAPRLDATPGRSERAGPALGADTDDVLRELAGASSELLADLRRRGTIA